MFFFFSVSGKFATDNSVCISSKFVTENSDCIWRSFYNRPQCLRHYKWNQNWDGTSSSSVFFSFFNPWADAPHVYVRASTLCCLHSVIISPNLSEGADTSGGLLRGDKECAPASQWCNQVWQSLEDGAGKRCSECARQLGLRRTFNVPTTTIMTKLWNLINKIKIFPKI